MLFSGVLGLSALLLFLSVVSLDCCFCCCLSCCALLELSGSAVHVTTELSTSCTVTAHVLLEVSSNAFLLLALFVGFWCFCLFLALLMPSLLLHFVGVDDGGLDPLGTLALFAMVEMILFDNVVMLCFCCHVCFCVVVEECLAFRVRLLSGGILRGMSLT